MSKEDKDKTISEALNVEESQNPAEDEENPENEEVIIEDKKEIPAKVEKAEDKKETPPEQPKPDDKKEPPVTDRYKASTKESQVLFLKKTKYEEAVRDAKNYVASEADLKEAYPEWDEMTATEQRLAKDNLENKMKFAKVAEATDEGDRIQEWSDKVDSFLLTDASKAGIEGKEDEFKTFCMKPTRRGLDINDLAKIFLWDESDKPAGHKGNLLETGSGGGGNKPAEDTMDEKQAAALRVGNHKLYQKLVRQGKIKINLD